MTLPIAKGQYAGLQFSRGCPYQCEFCDIIVLSRGREAFGRCHPWARLKGQAMNVIRCAVLYWRLMRGVDDPQLRATYRRRMWRLLQRRRNPVLLLAFLLRCTAHFHIYTMTRQMARTRMISVNPFY